MGNMKKGNMRICGILILMLEMACVHNEKFDAPKSNCTADMVANVGYTQVMGLYSEETIQIQEDWIIEGYVISSDKAGNFFNVLHFQDSPLTPSAGFQMEIDLRDSHWFYPVGTKIFVRLKGLYLGKSGEVFKLGGVFTAFGNKSVGRLPAAVLDDHLFIACEGPVNLAPQEAVLDSLTDDKINTLVRLDNVEILETEVGLPFAVPEEETPRTLTNCRDRTLIMLNSGFSDFQKESLPDGNGNIMGVLLKDGTDFQLVIRDMEDINFNLERCGDFVDEFTSTKVFISELADPNNNSAARFVELFNAGPESLSLKGWKLLRYTNDNTEVGSSIDLSDLFMDAGGTLVISPNAAEFESVYGFPPNLEVGTNSPADSNGDDNFELVDPFGTIIDVFGVVGQDGSGTNHEFEDGKAVRKGTVTEGNPSYDFDEWDVFNDSGASGTINEPQNAPEDFNPGNRD